MSETTVKAPAHPTTDDAYAWKAYWRALDMPWRTEPEVDGDRQRYLAQRRAGPVDFERLLATRKSVGMSGPVDGRNPHQRGRLGVDLRGADLSQVDLHRMPLAGLRGSLSFEEAGEGATDIVDVAAISLVRAKRAPLWR
jgi:hypothetical protein